MHRDLDGFYYRVKRGEKIVNRCFSDLTEEEQDEFLKGCSEEGLRRMAKELARILRTLGDQFDILGGYSGEEDGEE